MSSNPLYSGIRTAILGSFFVIAGIASSMFFLGLQNAIIYSVFLAAVESIDFKVDDNILIPFSASLLKSLLK